MDLIVLAKEPLPGRVKTRLCPPCSPADAAQLAEAALRDTLAAAVGAGADQVLLALEGQPGEWCPPGVVVVDQGTGLLADRLAHAWSHVDGPAVLVGMDTPQVGASDLGAAMAWLDAPDVDAVFGMATDGGWWTLGLARPQPGVFAGIPTSRSDTGRLQAERLRSLGLRVRGLPVRTDVDDWADALAVARAAPHTAFAAAVRGVLAPVSSIPMEETGARTGEPSR